MKIVIQPTLSGLFALALLSHCPQAVAQEASPSQGTDAERIQRLEEAVDQLQQQNQQLRQQLDQIQSDQDSPASAEEEPTSTGTEEEPEASTATDNDVRVYWNNGLKFESGDGKYEGQIGGRIMWDTAFYQQDTAVERLPGVGDLESGTEFRRARLFTDGTLRYSTPLSYKLQLDFAGGEVEFKDAYLAMEEVPGVGTIKAGHYKEPFSLEELTSSKYITFMERAMPNEVFSPARNLGVSIGKPELNERMTWAAGVFTDVDDDAVGSVESNYRFTGRLTGTPWYEQEDRLLHLGLSGSFVEPRGEMVRFRARPESHLAPRLVDTGAFSADQQYLMALESALVYGPFSLQGEYFRNWVDRNNFSNPTFGGYYLYGSWFVTGEHRPYDPGSGDFGRVKPRENFSLTDGGIGAWELGIRYSQLDLDDAGISGGDMGAWTGGVNWHLNPNVRLMFNYIFAQVDRNDLEGDAHAFQTRFQVDF